MIVYYKLGLIFYLFTTYKYLSFNSFHYVLKVIKK